MRTLAPARVAALYREREESERRMDMRFAMLACLVANALAKKEDGSAFTLDDFLPWHMEKPEQSVDEMLAVMEALVEKKPEG